MIEHRGSLSLPLSYMAINKPQVTEYLGCFPSGFKIFDTSNAVFEADEYFSCVLNVR